jgi:hypothetical protein
MIYQNHGRFFLGEFHPAKNKMKAGLCSCSGASGLNQILIIGYVVKSERK